MNWKLKYEKIWERLGMKSEYHVGFNAPLHPQDTENQTFGCRANNPDICNNNMLNNICAFCRDDHICKKPSIAWKKKFHQLVKA